MTLLPEHTVSQRTVGLSAVRPVRVQPIALKRLAIAPHDHDFYEIFIVLAGRCRHLSEGGGRDFGPGSVAVMAPGRIHAIERADADVVNVYYLAEWLLTSLDRLWAEEGLVGLFLQEALFRRPPRADVPQFTLAPSSAAACQRDLADIVAELGRSAPSGTFLAAALTKLLVRLTRAAISAGEAEPLGFRAEVWRFLEAVEEAAARGEPVSGGCPTAPSVISRDHLARLVRGATGLSPTAYFQRRRVQHAAVRLLNPARTVTEVALESGFADAAHFTRFFRRWQGMSPSAYRRRYAPPSPTP